MPQMAPISWLSLFFLFSITFIIFNVMNYFCYLPKAPSQQNSNSLITPKSMTWKW